MSRYTVRTDTERSSARRAAVTGQRWPRKASMSLNKRVVRLIPHTLHWVMGVFELTITLLLVGAILSMWAERFGIPYPALLALAGAALTFIPGSPTVVLDPQLALALFVAPVLLDAAFDASPRDL